MIASDKIKELFCEAEGVKRSDTFSIFLDIFFSLSGLSNKAATTSEQTRDSESDSTKGEDES